MRSFFFSSCTKSNQLAVPHFESSSCGTFLPGSGIWLTAPVLRALQCLILLQDLLSPLSVHCLVQEKSGCQPGASHCSPMRIPSAASVMPRTAKTRYLKGLLDLQGCRRPGNWWCRTEMFTHKQERGKLDICHSEP